MESLNASGVCRKYGKQEVLKDFSLKMAPGSFEALMGPSGSQAPQRPSLITGS